MVTSGVKKVHACLEIQVPTVPEIALLQGERRIFFLCAW